MNLTETVQSLTDAGIGLVAIILFYNLLSSHLKQMTKVIEEHTNLIRNLDQFIRNKN